MMGRGVTALWAAMAVVTTMALPGDAKADVFQSRSNSQCLANVNGRAILQPCSVSRHDNRMRYIPQENVFYGPLQQGGQCLDIQNNHVLFAHCNGSRSQIWKFSGSGQLNNEIPGWCVVGQGGNLALARCPATGAWLNASYKVIRVPNMANVPRGTPLTVNAKGDIVVVGTNQMVAAGGGNMVAAGGGNVLPTGAGHMVAAGGGNMVIIGRNAQRMVAAGGGN